MELSEELRVTYQETAKQLKGHERRIFMARIVNSLGVGGQRRAQQELGWCGDTIRKGQQELASGIPVQDHFDKRGRKKAEAKHLHLLADIQAIVDGQSQTDATFQSQRLYTRLSASQVRKQLIQQKGYREQDVPSQETIRVKLNQLGYRLRAVQKSRPQGDS